MTDDVEFFSPVANRKNITIKDINEVRKDSPWSIEWEKIPPRIDSESEYAKYFLENNVKIPTLLRRFASTWERFTDYEGFIFMDCDIIPMMDEEGYKMVENYFCNHIDVPGKLSKDKITILPAGGRYDSHHYYLKELATLINKKYKITDKEIEDNFVITDGNFRTLKFPNKSQIKPFFELLNNVVYDILNDEQTFFFLRIHSMWNLQSEQILSILFNLLGVQPHIYNESFGIPPNVFKVHCFPEDRFWNFGLHMESSLIGRQDFIDKNYDKLKTFYENRGQKFPY